MRDHAAGFCPHLDLEGNFCHGEALLSLFFKAGVSAHPITEVGWEGEPWASTAGVGDRARQPCRNLTFWGF